ncbi:MAG: MMPL family transporter [Oenococcus sp.]|uniref:MMPL family transporter n=1 Tax=Oenococcus TaxID=46254 RepID=UPI0021E8D1D2|nr:MMPL family transporter [Oenococcus kitaharae]MCV3295837.1 MMPL family transporter [Oenococcus kitaharae]
MKQLLKKFGFLISHHAKITIAAVLVLVGISVFAGIRIGSAFQSGGMSIKGSQSERANQLMEKEFPATRQTGGRVTVVFHATNGQTLTAASNRQAVNRMLDEAKKDHQIKTAVGPEMLRNYSPDGKTAYGMVIYKQKGDKVSQKTVDKLRKSIKITREKGIQTEISSTDVTISEIDNGESAEIVGIIVAFAVLAITFASLLIAGLPILSALIGLISGIMLVFIASHSLSVASFALSLVGMMGLAVGIDYALFIVSRYRQELALNDRRDEALAKTMSTAGMAVLFAGITVIIALLGMSVLGISMLSTMGITAAISVATAIVTSLTLVPAVLSLLGDRVSAQRSNRFLELAHHLRIEGGWGRLVTKFKGLFVIAIIAVLALLTVPLPHINLGLPNDAVRSEKLTERRAYDLMTKAYGKGSQATLVVLAETSDKTIANKTVTKLSQLKNVASARLTMPSQNNRYQMITVIPKTDSNSSQTKDLVHRVRDNADKNGLPKMLVTGSTAINIDMSDALLKALPKFAILIIAFAFILLMMIFRSLLIPLVAVLGFVLSLGATLGSVVFIIQDGHFINLLGISNKSSVLNFLPVLVIGIMFGLAMDYEVFLVSRMREEYAKHHDTRQAVIAGTKKSGTAIMAAALIMMAVFSGFIFASDAIVKSMGLALTLGILFDAVLVRMILVPASITLFGNASWYLPKWLDRILPNISID